MQKDTSECPAASKTAANINLHPQEMQSNASGLRRNAYMNMDVLGLPGCHMGSKDTVPSSGAHSALNKLC